MAIEMLNEHMLHIEGGPIDIHTHPRKFDAQTDDMLGSPARGYEGKAGLRIYTEVALRSGITAMLAMSNESVRVPLSLDPLVTETRPYSIATPDRLLASQYLTATEAYIPVGDFFGLDPEETYVDKDKQQLDTNKLYDLFGSVAEDCIGLKIYGDETTGGYNIDVKDISSVVQIWNEVNPEHPIVLHLENENVSKVLESIYKLPHGKDMPIHIAHVSSIEELDGVIAAKQFGMNVTCEVTPHHLFLDATLSEVVPEGFSHVKPTLKERRNQQYLRAKFHDWIDDIASDCAPHRSVDKEKGIPGLANHSVLLPLALGAVQLEAEKPEEERWITLEDINKKMVVNPRKRFNLPMNDGSSIDVDISPETNRNAMLRDSDASRKYGYNPFAAYNGNFDVPMIGRVVNAQAGKSSIRDGKASLHTSYTHVISPRTLKAA